MLHVCLLKEDNCLSVPSWSQVWAGISWKEGVHEEGDPSALGLLPSPLRWAVAWLSLHLLQASEHPQVCRRRVGLGRAGGAGGADAWLRRASTVELGGLLLGHRSREVGLGLCGCGLVAGGGPPGEKDPGGHGVGKAGGSARSLGGEGSPCKCPSPWACCSPAPGPQPPPSPYDPLTPRSFWHVGGAHWLLSFVVSSCSLAPWHQSGTWVDNDPTRPPPHPLPWGVPLRDPAFLWGQWAEGCCMGLECPQGCAHLQVCGPSVLPFLVPPRLPCLPGLTHVTALSLVMEWALGHSAALCV